MKGCRLVVFDLDGTLVDSLRDIGAAVNDAVQAVAPDAPSLTQQQINEFVGEGPAVLIARSLAAIRLDRRVEELLPLYIDAYGRRMLETTRFYPGALEALDALRDRTLCVLSNKPGDLSRALLAGLGAGHHFARIWGVGDTPARKPDPSGLRMLMRDFGAGEQETVIVGDSAVDVATGRAAGAFTVGVSYGFDPLGVASSRPDAVVGDLRDLLPLLGVPEPEAAPPPSA